MDGFVAILRTRNASSEAEPLLKAALSLEETAKDSSLALLAGRQDALGDFYAGEGRQFDALAAYQRALHLYEAANAGNDALLSEIDKVIGVEVATSRFQEADALYRRSLELEVPDYKTLKLDELHETSQSVSPAGPNKPSIVSRLEKYAIFRSARGDPQAAAALHRRALLFWANVLEQDLADAATVLDQDDTKDWYDLKRWKLLMPIYHELGDIEAEKRTAKLLTEVNDRQEKASASPSVQWQHQCR